MDKLLFQYDCVFINDLTLPMFIGIYDHEKANVQNVIINVKIYVPKWDSAMQADIDDVVSYEVIVGTIKELCTSRHFDLVEDLAENIAAICLQNNLTQAVDITIEKPDIIPETQSVGVRIFRQKALH